MIAAVAVRATAPRASSSFQCAANEKSLFQSSELIVSPLVMTLALQAAFFANNWASASVPTLRPQ